MGKYLTISPYIRIILFSFLSVHCTHKIALLYMYFMHKVCQEKRGPVRGQNANILRLLKSRTSGHRGGQIKKSVYTFQG
jgi:hypothetical protein